MKWSFYLEPRGVTEVSWTVFITDILKTLNLDCKFLEINDYISNDSSAGHLSILARAVPGSKEMLNKHLSDDKSRNVWWISVMQLDTLETPNPTPSLIVSSDDFFAKMAPELLWVFQCPDPAVTAQVPLDTWKTASVSPTFLGALFVYALSVFWCGLPRG